MDVRVALMKRSLTRFVRQPVSVRNAMRVIMVATLLSVLVGGVLIRIVEPNTYPNIGVGLWWSIQTVTTVGYGDVTPKTTLGRFVGALIMLQSIAFVTVITATITSSFVERWQRERRVLEHAEGLDDERRLHARFDELAARLERIENAIDRAGNNGQT
jgi:voltage-gated potassium channel